MKSIDDHIHLASAIIAGVVPLILSVLSASPEPYWLDSPEFTAAAQSLGLPHPPGHPLYVLATKIFTLLPFGGIAFRVALASAVHGAMASTLLYLICFAVASAAAREVRGAHRSLAALAGTFSVVFAYGWRFQCVRAEVYALEILLVLGALYPLVHYVVSVRKDARWMYLSAFLFGLALSNHHFIALAALPAALPVLVYEARARGGLGAVRFAARLALTAAAGLLPYLLLPLRSLAGTPISLGAVTNLADFFWVVSAKVYQKSMTNKEAGDFTDRSADVLFSQMEQVGPLLVIAAIVGLLILVRSPGNRLLGGLFLLLGGVMTLLRAVMGFDPFNPDYYGYMMPTLAALAVGVAVIWIYFTRALNNLPGKWPALSTVVLVVALLIPINRSRASYAEADLSDFKATRLFYDFSCRQAHPQSILLTSYYKAFFVLWSARFVDGSRPDLLVANPFFLGYPGYAADLIAGHPELSKLTWSILVHNNLLGFVIADLSLSHNLRLEIDHSYDPELLRYLLPDGPIYRSFPEPLDSKDVAAAGEGHLARWRHLYKLLGEGWRENETKRLLTWYHFQDAMFFARRGARSSAKEAVGMGLSLGPEQQHLKKLGDLLHSDEGRGPVDIRPFMPRLTGDSL